MFSRRMLIRHTLALLRIHMFWLTISFIIHSCPTAAAPASTVPDIPRNDADIDGMRAAGLSEADILQSLTPRYPSPSYFSFSLRRSHSHSKFHFQSLSAHSHLSSIFQSKLIRPKTQAQPEDETSVAVLVSFDDLAGSVAPGIADRIQDADDWVVRLVDLMESFLMDGYGGWIGRLTGPRRTKAGKGKMLGEEEDTGKVIFGRDVPRVEIIRG